MKTTYLSEISQHSMGHLYSINIQLGMVDMAKLLYLDTMCGELGNLFKF